MKRYLSLFITTLFIFIPYTNALTNYDASILTYTRSSITGSKFYDNLNSFRDYNQGSDVCSHNNSYYNSTQIIDTNNVDSATSSVVYDIAYVDIKGDKLYLYGWAFNKSVDNDLGNQTTPYDSSDDTWISFALGTSSGYGRSEAVPSALSFSVSYANPNNLNHTTGDTNTYKKLKYYDLTYWNCTRTSSGTKDYNGKPTGGLCMDGTTRQLVGGFEASIDLNVVRNYIEQNNAYDRNNKKEYYVYMFVDSSVRYTNGSDREAVWFKIGAFDNSDTISASTKAYRGITLNGLSKNAKIVVNQGRLTGDNGLYCSSPAQRNKASTYFIRNTTYAVKSKKVAYRGANSARYYQTLYELSIARPNIQNVGSGTYTTAYAPATWLEFTGQMKITFEKPEDEGVCPTGTKGYNGTSTPFNNYYIFLAKANNNELDTLYAGNKLMINTTDEHKFSDELVFQKNIQSVLGSGTYNLNYIQMLDKKEIALNSSNIADFFTKYISANNSSTKYVQNGNDFYVIAAKYKADGSWNNIVNDLPSNDKNYFARRAMYSINHSITSRINPDNDGYAFTVSRNLYDADEKVMIATNPITNSDTYYHPILYKVSYCVTEQQRECTDIVNSAECYPDDSGTKVVFHEDDRLNTCTLTKNNNSGFNIVEYSETNNYCTVACKDDLDIELPTAKNVTAGQYFTLDNYTPKITAKRTCVTSKIDYDRFESTLKAAERDMITKYNIWQDWIEIDNKAEISKSSHRVGCCRWSETDGDGNVIASGCSGDCYSNHWTINAVQDTPNSIVSYPGANGSWSTGCCSSGRDTSSTVYYNGITKSLNNAKTAYNNAKTLYDNLKSQYTKCSSWLDNTKFTFDPTVKFDYEDDDSQKINFNPTSLLYKDKDGHDRKSGSLTDDEINPITKKTYWTEYEADTNETYTIGGDNTADLGDSKDKITFNIVHCEGKTCDESDRTENNEFFTSKYIKREEIITYEYFLPKLYTAIPSGEVKKSSYSGLKIKLEDNAVPININTEEGEYNYIIQISGIEDTLRSSKSSKNSDDNFKERFNSVALNAGDEYVCNYNVINDSYDPSKKSLKFFYRTIDLGNVNPTGRALGYNWTSNRAEKVISNMEITSENYQELREGSDKFSFTLTPATLKEIRDYNDTTNNLYSDFDFECYDYNSESNTEHPGGYHCYSNFLTCLASNGTEDETGSCPLDNYNINSNYNYNDLTNNRRILINKQRELDLRDNIGGTS